MSVLDQIKALDEQKAKLLKNAKQEALINARAAINDLNSLGFNYHLAEGEGAPTTGTRRSGVRQQVQDLLSNSPDGLKRADILDAMNVKGDKKGEQSVSNALSSLKKAGTLTQNSEGSYTIN